MKKTFLILISLIFLCSGIFFLRPESSDKRNSLRTQNKKISNKLNKTELLLKKIATGQKISKKIKLRDGSTISCRKNGGIDLFNAHTKKTIFLSDHIDFKHLLDGATKIGGFKSYGNIMAVTNLTQFLDSNVHAFYSQFRGGNYRARNIRGSGRFRYKRIRQVLASRSVPDSVDQTSQIRGFDCYCSSVTHILKSLGLIVPDYSRIQVESRYTHIFNDLKMGRYRKAPWDKNYTIPWHFREALRGRSTFTPGQKQLSTTDFLEIAKGLRKTNWAKLTGMGDVQLRLSTKGSINSVLPFIKIGYVARVCLTEGFPWHYVAPVDIQVRKKNKLVVIDDSWFVKKVLIYTPAKFKNFWVIYVQGKKSNIQLTTKPIVPNLPAEQTGLILSPLSVAKDYVPFINVYWLPKDSRILNFNSHLIQNITPLARIKALRELDLSNNPLKKIAPLSRLHNLESLNLRRTYVTDLSPLSKLKKLAVLNIKHTPVKNIAMLPRSLKKLYLDSTINKKQIKNFRTTHPLCVIYTDDGYIDKDPRKGPLDGRWVKR